MATIEKKIYLYNFTTKLSLTRIFDDYNAKLNNDRHDLDKRGLVFSSQTDPYNYFLDIIDKVPVKAQDNSQNINYFYKCILYKLRYKDLPYIFNVTTGAKDLIAVKPKDTIMEQTHFIVFPEINLIVSEFNNAGARIEKLRSVLDFALNLNSIDFSIVPILRSDNYKKIIGSSELKSFTVKTGHGGLASLDDAIGVNLLETLDNTYDNLSDLQIEITISGAGKKHLKIKNVHDRITKLTTVAKKLLDDKSNDKIDKNGIIKLKAKMYEDEHLVPIDLLEEKLVYTPKVVKVSDASKYLDPEDMFRNLLESYNFSERFIDRIVKVDIISSDHMDSQNQSAAAEE